MSQFKDWWNRSFNGKRIAMLGLKDAGKSQFLKSLGCKEANPGVRSQKEKYNWFKVSYPNKEVYIKAGYDIGGGLELFKQTFNKRIKDSDWVFFIIDIDKYLNDGRDVESGASYQEQVNYRLDHINTNVSKRFFDKIAIILSHADMVPQAGSELINTFQRMTREKAYSVLTSHCYPMDAREGKEVRYCFKRVVGL